MGDMTANFSRWEFACKCKCGSDNINPLLVQRLESARQLFGRGITITSGCRCKTWNAKVGGEARSSHLTEINGLQRTGLAVDIACFTSPTRMRLLMALLTVGFERVGIGENFIHVDLDLTLPQDVCWVYPAEKSKW